MNRGVVWFVRLVGVAALVLLAGLFVAFPPSSRTAPAWAAAVTVGLLLALTEAPGVRVSFKFRSQGESFTLSEAVLFVMFGLFNPGACALIMVLGGVSANSTRRMPLIKRAFNSFQYVISVGVGALVAWAVAGSHTVGSGRNLAGAGAGLLAYAVLNKALVAGVIALSSGQRFGRVVVDGLPVTLLSLAGLAPIGALALVLLTTHPLWLFVLVAPTVVLFLSQRSYILGNRRTETTESLLGLAEELSRALEIEARTLVLVDGIRDILKAEDCEVILLAEGGPRRTSIDADARPLILEPLSIESGPNPYASVLATGEARILRAGDEGPLAEWLDHHGKLEMVVVPVSVEGQIRGILTAAGRLGQEGFKAEDLKVLTAISQLAGGPLAGAQAYAAERASVERLRELDRMKSDVLASVSHELRTPLTLIHGFAMTLQSHGDRLEPEEKEEFLTKITRNSTRLARLIDSMMAASKWDSAGADMGQSAPVETVVADVVDQVADLAEGRSIVVDVAPGLPRLGVGSQRVELVLRNLVENALKYADGGVLVQATPHPDGVALEVTDQGPGIPPEEQVRIFERFYQIDQSSTRKVGGTGLGLYLVKNLTEAVGGHVDVESSPGRGSTFRVVFPAGGAAVIPLPLRHEGRA